MVWNFVYKYTNPEFKSSKETKNIDIPIFCRTWTFTKLIQKYGFQIKGV